MGSAGSGLEDLRPIRVLHIVRVHPHMPLPMRPVAVLFVLVATACGGSSPTANPTPNRTDSTPAQGGANGTMLVADNSADAYAVVNRVLGGNAIESPDCIHPLPHITQESDAVLGKNVFVFHSHVTPDNDRCTATDRQRIEIKTYGPSPEKLKARLNDTTVYRWRMKMDAGFQPSNSFTHLHQLKAGDGDDEGAPIITITPRAGTPQRLQVIHVASGNTSTTVAQPELAPFKGEWLDIHSRVVWSDSGSYWLEIRRVSDNTVLLTYQSNRIDLWRTAATFARPKWGIYRSLNNRQQLRDEQVRFDRFCLGKGKEVCGA